MAKKSSKTEQKASKNKAEEKQVEPKPEAKVTLHA